MIRALSRLNIPLLIISLLLSLTLWIVVQAQTMQIESKDITVPLNYVNLDPRFVLIQIPPTVPVTVTGPSDKLNDPGLKNAQAVVDLHDAQEGSHTYNAIVKAPDPDSNRLLPRDTVKVTVDLATKVSQLFKVVVETRGRLADRSVMYSGAQADPPFVEYSGSESALKSIAKVRAVLDLDDIDPDQPDKTKQCRVEALDRLGHPLLPSKVLPSVAEVTVRPEIDPATVEKDLFIIPTVVGRPAAGFEVTGYEAIPEKLSVTGASMKLAESSSVPTLPIDVSGLSATVTLPARLELPPNLKRVAQKSIEVRIDIRREQTPAAPPAGQKKPADPGFPDHVPPLYPSKGGSH